MRARAIDNAVTRREAKATELAALRRREMRRLDRQAQQQMLLQQEQQASLAFAAESEERRRRLSLDDERTAEAVHRARLAMEYNAREEMLENAAMGHPYVDDIDIQSSVFTGGAGVHSRFSPFTASEHLFY